MRTRLLPLLGALVSLLIALPPQHARASIVQAMSMQEMVADADHVVLATVVDQEARRDALGRIVTDYTLRVSESLRGGTPEGGTLVVRRLGGVLGDLGMQIEGEAHFELGEEIILFARDVSGVMRPVGMSQGVLPVRREAGGDLAMPGGAGATLVRRGPDGALVPGTPALSAPMALDELLAQLRDLIASTPRSR